MDTGHLACFSIQLIYFVANVQTRSQRYNTQDAHVFVRNGQIFEMMLAHDFPCLIHRLIFEAIIRLGLS
jgi:hypothetical protein